MTPKVLHTHTCIYTHTDAHTDTQRDIHTYTYTHPKFYQVKDPNLFTNNGKTATQMQSSQVVFCRFSFLFIAGTDVFILTLTFPYYSQDLSFSTVLSSFNFTPAATSKKVGYAVLTGMCPIAEAICFPGALFIFPCEFFSLDFCCWLSDSFVLALSVRNCLRLNSLNCILLRQRIWLNSFQH